MVEGKRLMKDVQTGMKKNILIIKSTCSVACYIVWHWLFQRGRAKQSGCLRASP